MLILWSCTFSNFTTQRLQENDADFQHFKLSGWCTLCARAVLLCARAVLLCARAVLLCARAVLLCARAFLLCARAVLLCARALVISFIILFIYLTCYVYSS